MKTLDVALAKVDRLGLLLAQIADLEAEAEVLKNELKQQEGHIEGSLYKGCVTLSERKTVDNKAVFADRKSTRLNSSHIPLSRMPSSA